MHRPGAVLIGFQDQPNLGLGYLAATLHQHGLAADIIDFRDGPEAILNTIRSVQPALVGFSLIFQYYLPQFAELAAYLRANGVRSHFCVGGHYPTLRPEETLRAVPQLDSVGRGEGELTLLELLQCLVKSQEWRNVCGLAYRADDVFAQTPPRPLIANLDQLPYPIRPPEPGAILGRKVTSILASRGCARNCSFCSIRQFYGQTPGHKVRFRDPVQVAAEMRVLFRDQGIQVFFFQDDDFPLHHASGGRWVNEFMRALRAEELVGKVIWKISCRADEVEAELFARMRDTGLYMVYLGLESGNETGLRTLNKGSSVADGLRAVAALKAADLFCCYGFMMFDPSSTFGSVRANAAFLRRATGDGTATAHFCRMVPYAGTPIEAQLGAAGRLRGDAVNPDYDFLDPRLDALFHEVNEATLGWSDGPDNLSDQLTWAWHEYWILHRLFPPLPGLESYRQFLCALTRAANERLLATVGSIATACQHDHSETPSAADAQPFREQVIAKLTSRRNAFILKHQPAILAALEGSN